MTNVAQVVVIGGVARLASLPDTTCAVSDVATARRRALGAGRTEAAGVASLGDIVAVPPVREARGQPGVDAVISSRPIAASTDGSTR